ncbi:MAG: FecR domain-containing protein [Candidatus Omnitrophica bacterium]|nr:FecR domain-containing protein [Candidatus Omnitrophota bacterium]
MKTHIQKTRLSFYVDGECSPEEAIAIRGHVRECSACREQLKELEMLRASVEQLSEVMPSEGYDRAFQERLKNTMSKQGIFGVLERGFAEVYSTIKISLDQMRWGIIAVPRPVKVAVSTGIIILLFALSYLPGGDLPLLISFQGVAEVYGAEENRWEPAIAGIQLSSGTKIKTGPYSFVDIDQDNLYRMRAKENTIIVAKQLIRHRRKGETCIQIEQGKLLVKTDKKFKGSQITIETPSATAVVRGTGFCVDVQPITGETWLGVSNGEVEIKNHAYEKIVLVKAPQKTIVKPDQKPQDPLVMTDGEWERLQEIHDIGRILVSLILSNKGDRVRELFGPVHFYVHGRYPEPVQKLATQALALSSRAKRENSRKKHLKSISLLNNIVEQFPDERNDPQILLFIAAYFEKLAMHKEAIESLDRLIQMYPTSKWASLAQCAIGIIQEEKLGNPQEAIAAYQKILSHYPSTLEVGEATAGLRRLKK